MGAFFVACGLAFLGAAVTGGDWTRWVVAAVNGLVLFVAAEGANQLTAERATARVIGEFGVSQVAALDELTQPVLLGHTHSSCDVVVTDRRLQCEIIVNIL